jgi:hypothetical protein
MEPKPLNSLSNAIDHDRAVVGNLDQAGLAVQKGIRLPIELPGDEYVPDIEG